VDEVDMEEQWVMRLDSWVEGARHRLTTFYLSPYQFSGESHPELCARGRGFPYHVLWVGAARSHDLLCFKPVSAYPFGVKDF